MTSFLTLLYVQTNALSSEKIAFGLLGVSGPTVYLKTSPQKLAIVGRLLSSQTVQLIKANLETLRRTVYQQNKIADVAKGPLFPEAPTAFNADYIKSLVQYSNGLIQFGEVLPVGASLTSELFQQLYSKFIGEGPQQALPASVDFKKQIEKALTTPKLADKADINYTLEPEHVEGLLKSTNVLLLTAHNRLIAMQKVDFTNTEDTIAHRLYEFEAVTEVLNEYSNKLFKVNGEFKIVAEPPAAPVQKQQYETIKHYKKKLFTIISTAELAAEALKISANGHSKGSQYLESDPEISAIVQ